MPVFPVTGREQHEVLPVRAPHLAILTPDHQGHDMSERRLRKQCSRLLRQLGMEPPFNVNELCRRLGGQRGRPIRLEAMAMAIPAPGPFGMWLSLDSEDVIFYQQETSPLHQLHIVLHEVGHMIAGHDSDEGDDELLQMLFPNLDPEVARRWLRRTDYHSREEADAEKLATIMLEWVWEIDSRAPELPRTEAGRRLSGGLRDHIGWI